MGDGAEGDFVSHCMVRALGATDWAVPVRVTSGSARRESSPVEHIRIDFTNAAALAACLQGAWGVVNCVTRSVGAISTGATALAAAVRAMSSAPRLVYVSSQSVYGDAAGEVDETLLPVGALSAYGAAKAAAEREVGIAGAVILRPGIIYGPGSSQWSERIADWLIHRRLGDLGRQGDGYCNLVYIDDLVDAIIRCLQGTALEGKVFNLSLPHPPTWNDYLIRYARALGAVPVARITRRRLAIETQLLAAPLKLLQLAAQKGWRGAASFIPEPIPPSAAHVFQQEIRLSVAAARTILGMTWTDLDEGLAAAAGKYRESSREFR